MHPNDPQFQDATYEGMEKRWKNYKGAQESISERDPKERKRLKDENTREYDTAEMAHQDVSIQQLDAMAKEGMPTEISGDAIARVKQAQYPKYHRG